MPAEHKLKCWSVYWDAIERGDKNFEVRRDDRGFQKGDVLVLEKFDPEKHRYEFDGYDYSAKIKTLRRKILYVLTGGQFGIEPGHVVMALGKEEDNAVAEGMEKIRDALQFDVKRQEAGHIAVTHDAYWNLDGALEDMRRTGKADEVCIRTVERVLDQLHEAREIVRKAIKDEGATNAD